MFILGTKQNALSFPYAEADQEKVLCISHLSLLSKQNSAILLYLYVWLGKYYYEAEITELFSLLSRELSHG